MRRRGRDPARSFVRRQRRAIDGGFAAAAALAATWAASAAHPAVVFPPYALADRIVRLAPGGLATFLIEKLQHDAQRLLSVLSIIALLGAGGAIASFAGRRRPPAPATAGVAFSALVLGVEWADPVPHSPLDLAFSTVLGGAAFALALHALWRDAERLRRADSAAEDDAMLTRRRALLLVGGSTVGLLAAGTVGGQLLGVGGPTQVALEKLRPRRRRRPPFPDIPGLLPEVTSISDHYVVDIDLSDPVVDAGGWRLQVGGLVERPLTLGFDELQSRFELTQEYSTLTCISNRVGGPLVGNSLWEGVALRDLLAAARPRGRASEVIFRCVDGYSVGVPLAAATHRSALVAIAQNGQPLAREHGFPCRIRLPALYGMMNAKWVESIELADRPYLGYWQQQGWADAAAVRTESRIDTRGPVRAGRAAWIAGVAWAGDRGVSAVEVSTDAGQGWTRALLHEPLSPVAWTQWAYGWTPPRPGVYTIACRAIDGTGTVQEARVRPPHPSGASGYHKITVTAA